MVYLVVIFLIQLVLFSRSYATIIWLATNIVGSMIDEIHKIWFGVFSLVLSLLMLVFLLCRFWTFAPLTTECEKWDFQGIALLGPWPVLITT